MRIGCTPGFAGQDYALNRLTGGRWLAFHLSRRRRRWGFERDGRKDLTALLFHLFDFGFDGGNDVVVLFQVFQEIADVQEGVAVESDIHKGRLHAGQHACNPSFVDASYERKFFFALNIDFAKLPFFQNGDPRLVRGRGNNQLFGHENSSGASPRAGARR